ncbi:hypothetical protein [Paenibacillus ferrarius]|uniref:hypothetical protein n=1 Tax=Paenibacillus ferrarius TaxID=1469647 RepID=UPI003D2A2CE5
MSDAFTVFIGIILLGLVIFIKVWWDGTGMSMKFTKWYFAFFFSTAVIGSICTFLWS